MKRKFSSVILTLTLILSMFISASAVDKKVYNGLYYYISDGEAVICGHDSSFPEDLKIPTEIDGCPVTEIGESAFCGELKLTKVTIPEGVKVISDDAFFCCENLEEIELPDSLIEIGNGVFHNTKYDINENNWETGENFQALYIGKHLIDAYVDVDTAFKIKEGTLTVADYAFPLMGEFDEASMARLIIPDSVTRISEGMIYGERVTDVLMPDSITHIAEDFSNVVNLRVIYYEGSKEDWSKIEFENSEEALRNLKYVTIEYDVDLDSVKELQKDSEYSYGVVDFDLIVFALIFAVILTALIIVTVLLVKNSKKKKDL